MPLSDLKFLSDSLQDIVLRINMLMQCFPNFDVHLKSPRSLVKMELLMQVCDGAPRPSNNFQVTHAAGLRTTPRVVKPRYTGLFLICLHPGPASYLIFPPGIQVFTLSQKLSRLSYSCFAAFPLPGFLHCLFMNYVFQIVVCPRCSRVFLQSTLSTSVLTQHCIAGAYIPRTGEISHLFCFNNNFIEISFTYSTIHSFKVCNSVVFMFFDLASRLVFSTQ